MRVWCIQNEQGEWAIEVERESGIHEFIPLGKLTKEQAQREVLRRGYDRVVMADKEVCKALREGKVANKDILEQYE